MLLSLLFDHQDLILKGDSDVSVFNFETAIANRTSLRVLIDIVELYHYVGLTHYGSCKYCCLVFALQVASNNFLDHS